MQYEKLYIRITQIVYVMYDTNDEEIPIYDDFGNIVGYQKSYFTLAGFPLTYNFDNFSWVAVLRSEVDENYIFKRLSP